MIWGRFSQRLRTDEEGATLTEFGLVAPILFLMIIGIFDIAHVQYTSSLVNGALQKAGRDISLENSGSNEAAIDQRVKDQVLNVVPSNATVTLEKLSHFDFSDIGQEEEYTDNNGDGACNNGEPFDDANGNGQWDANRGEQSIGGARDAVLYTATVTWPRLFPLHGFIPSLPKDVTLEASTVLRNQPFDVQNREIPVGNCT